MWLRVIISEMVLKVVEYPAKILSKPARRLKPGDVDVKQLFADMVETMHAYDGVGLAAPQVGKGIRLLAAMDRDSGDIRCFINPQITAQSSDQLIGPEGCLSFPGLYGDVIRAKTITVRYQDLDFNEHTEEFSDFFARVLQHEIDHLNGVLLVDRAEDKLEPGDDGDDNADEEE